jgi:hypothetical protein
LGDGDRGALDVSDLALSDENAVAALIFGVPGAAGGWDGVDGGDLAVGAGDDVVGALEGGEPAVAARAEDEDVGVAEGGGVDLVVGVLNRRSGGIVEEIVRSTNFFVDMYEEVRTLWRFRRLGHGAIGGG